MKTLAKHFNLKLTFLIFVFSVLVCSNSFSKSYKPSFNVQDFINEQTDVKISLNDKVYTITPINTKPDTALIFYPGGKVQYEAYLPLLTEFAKKGILCVMPKMHRDLAIFNISSANKFAHNSEYTGIKNWYIGGHSLGGAMACVYANKHLDKIDGLVLLAAYSSVNLSNTDLKVISIYGSNDGVLKFDNYNKYKSNLPALYKEHILPGGNHGNFGSYGFQNGDNLATLDSTEQKKLSAKYTADFILK